MAGAVFRHSTLGRILASAHWLQQLMTCETKHLVRPNCAFSRRYRCWSSQGSNFAQRCHSPPARVYEACSQHARYYSHTTRHAQPLTQRNIVQRPHQEFPHQFRRVYSSNSSRSQIEDRQVNPQTLTKTSLENLSKRIKKELNTPVSSLREVSHYYFDARGKNIRPMIVLLMAGACNHHTGQIRDILASQHTVVMISEMIHTASLIHDDVIDGAETRRNKTSVNKLFGDKLCVLAGDYILSCASQALAKLGNPEVVKLLAQVVEDLVRGEIMQLGSKEDPDERFNHYLQKTYKKTASLIACCCKAVAVFGHCDPEVQDIAYQYGRNVGMAFQLVDDVLDFVASEDELGKPTAADLSLGLATAPVLFACEKFPDLSALIMRRFKEPGDIQFTWDAVKKSDGISQTYSLAERYAKEAVKQISKLGSSPEKLALKQITRAVVQRRS